MFWFAENQVTMADSEDALQISVHELETVTSKYALKMSASKVKAMAFRGRDPVRSKITINSNRKKDILNNLKTEKTILIKYQNFSR